VRFHFQNRLKLSEKLKRNYGVSLRGMTQSDLRFIQRLFARVRWPEFAASGMPPRQICALLRMQCNAQHQHYMQHFQKTDYGVLVGPDGQLIGRLYLDWGKEDLRIVDIALMPNWQQRGLGRALLECVFADAAAKGMKVAIHVEKNNPALKLYDRLGFRAVEDKEVYWFMEWTSDTGDQRPDIRSGSVLQSVG